MITVAELIQTLKQYPPNIPVFIFVDQDESPEQPVWRDGDMVVKHVDYDIPHIGGFYGDALVLGTDE
jgi:hypothetical protein